MRAAGEGGAKGEFLVFFGEERGCRVTTRGGGGI